MNAGMKGNGGGDRRPIPDPTTLTTEQLLREISALKELSLREVTALRDVVFTRVDAMDAAVRLLAEGVNKVPNETTQRVDHLKELVFTRFAERDLRNAQIVADSKEALTAARRTAEQAIGKAEEGLNKRFDVQEAALGALEDRTRLMMPRSESEALHKTHTEHIAALAARVDAREERGKGMSQSWGIVITIITAGAALLGIVLAVTRFTT